MGDFIFSIWVALQIIIGYNLILPFLLFLIWIVTKDVRISRLYQDARVPAGAVQHGPDYAIIVTAYQQTDSIPAVVNSILNLNYTNFLVYIVADNCDDTSNLSFDDARVILLKPPFVLQSNTRSHFYAISHFQRPHSHLTIIDSDNLVHPEYLNELNTYFERGFEAVQGVRNAKNLDTTYACLDAARDIYYHFYDGRVLFELGSSATLAGSGMAFTTSLYEECLGKLDIQGAGFDKVLQNEIVKRGNRIAFAEKAIVLDEKTSRPEQLVNQRSRWINTWFRYFTFGFGLMARGIAHLNFNQFLFGIILLRPPLFIFLLLSLACLLINIWISAWVTMAWIAGIFLFTTGFVLSLRMSDTDRKIYKSLYSIPKFVYFQILSLLHSRSANRRSVATTHYYSGMSDDNQRKENHES